MRRSPGRLSRGGAHRPRLALGPPAGTEAALYEIGGEEFLVFRVPKRAPDTDDQLSEAEREVAALAIAGLSNADIGKQRGTSARTVANQIASIFRKLGVGSRAELARRLVAGAP